MVTSNERLGVGSRQHWLLAFIVALSLPSPHMWTDTNGVSHLSKCEMNNFVLKSMKPPAAPQWQDRLQAEGAMVIVTVQPAGWVGTWHDEPKQQWIIPLSGRWFVETMDGRRQEMGPGKSCAAKIRTPGRIRKAGKGIYPAQSAMSQLS